MTPSDLWARALVAIESDADPERRDHGRAVIARRLGAGGAIDDAVRVAHGFESAFRGAVSLLEAAQGRWLTGDVGGARRCVAAALALRQERVDASDEFLSRSILARAVTLYATMDDPDEALRIVAQHPGCLLEEPLACAALACARAKRGDVEGAIATARAVTPEAGHVGDLQRWMALKSAAEALRKAGRASEARELAAAIGDPRWRDEALSRDHEFDDRGDAWRRDPRAVLALPDILGREDELGAVARFTASALAVDDGLEARRIALREASRRLAPLDAPGRRKGDLSDHDVKHLLANALVTLQLEQADFEGARESAQIERGLGSHDAAEAVARVAEAETAADRTAEAIEWAERLPPGILRAFAFVGAAAGRRTSG